MIQQLEEIAFSEDLSSVPSAHIGCSQLPLTPELGDLMLSSGLLKHLHACRSVCAHACMHARTHKHEREKSYDNSISSEIKFQ